MVIKLPYCRIADPIDFGPAIKDEELNINDFNFKNINEMFSKVCKEYFGVPIEEHTGPKICMKIKSFLLGQKAKGFLPEHIDTSVVAQAYGGTVHILFSREFDKWLIEKEIKTMKFKSNIKIHDDFSVSTFKLKLEEAIKEVVTKALKGGYDWPDEEMMDLKYIGAIFGGKACEFELTYDTDSL